MRFSFLAKKFDKISPKNISEAKFNQLVDALPSSAIDPPKKLIPEPEQKETAVKIKTKKDKKKKSKKEKNSEPKNSESTYTEPTAVPNVKKNEPKKVFCGLALVQPNIGEGFYQYSKAMKAI